MMLQSGKQMIAVKHRTQIFDVEGLCDTIWQVNTFQQINLMYESLHALKVAFFSFS